MLVIRECAARLAFQERRRADLSGIVVVAFLPADHTLPNVPHFVNGPFVLDHRHVILAGVLLHGKGDWPVPLGWILSELLEQARIVPA